MEQCGRAFPPQPSAASEAAIDTTTTATTTTATSTRAPPPPEGMASSGPSHGGAPPPREGRPPLSWSALGEATAGALTTSTACDGSELPSSSGATVSPSAPRCDPRHRHAHMGVSSSQSSGGGTAHNSRASSTSSAAATAADATDSRTGEKVGPKAEGDGGRAKDSRRATPSATPSTGRSPALGPATGMRVVAERPSRSGRKQRGGSGVGGGSGGGSAAAAVGSSDDPRHPRTAFDRCKIARTIAAQWMSQLMRNPPDAATIASLRAAREDRATAPGPQLLSPATPARQQRAAESSGGAHNSFLEAVLKPKGQATTSPAATTLDAAPSPSTPTAVANDKDGAAATSQPQHAIGSSSGNHGGGAPLHYESLELVPDDLSSIPPLLHALREIALSCASLDVLGKASSGGSPSVSSGSLEEGGARRRHKTGSAARTSSPPPLTPAVTAAADDAVLVTRSRRLHGEYEAQWSSVRAHFAAVRSFVLNDHELALALDAALGDDWRTEGDHATAEAEAVERGREGEGRGTPQLVALPEADASTGATAASSHRLGNKEAATSSSTTKSATTTVAAAVAASSPLSRAAKEYVPRDFHLTPPAALLPSSAESHATAATLAATSTLNSNAEPFRTRFASAVAAGTSSSPALAGDGSAAAGPALGERGPVGSPVYSPSQAVASFLERVLPSPRPDTVGGGANTLAVFPSTPPAREAAATSRDNSGPPSPNFTPASAATTGGVGGTSRAHAPEPLLAANGASTGTCQRLTPPHPPHGTGTHNTIHSSCNNSSQSLSQVAGGSAASAPAFRLESREDMLRRRSAAPNAFYGSPAHFYGGGGHPSSGAGNGGSSSVNPVSSAATTPASLFASSPNGLAHGMGYISPTGPARGPRSLPVSPLLSFGAPAAGPLCPFDYILVIDFEATCEEHLPAGYLYEIIEFPVVLVDVHLQRAVAEFHRFVKPRFKTQLSCFCKALTGIGQHDVDEAAPLEEVIVQFERWYHQTVPPNSRTVFATDGPMDFKEFMHNHSVLRQNIRFPSLFYQWIDVKQTFAHFFHCQQGKIKAMLEVLSYPFEGRLHSGIDDARNIARIVIGLLQWGCTFCDIPLNRIPMPPSTVSAPSGGAQHAGKADGAATTVAGGTPSSMTSLSGSLPFGSPLHLPPSAVANSANQHGHH